MSRWHGWRISIKRLVEAFPVKTTKRQQVELKGNRRIFVICEALSLQSCLAKKGCGWPHLVAGFREFKVEKDLKPCHGANLAK